MIYTSGTNRILTINEADSTKVGWVADKNDATNGKLVFSDADVNWSNNSTSPNVSGNTNSSLPLSINCSTVNYGGPKIVTNDSTYEYTMSYNNLGYIWTNNYLTFCCGDSSGDGDFYKVSGAIAEPLYTRISFNTGIWAVEGKGRTVIRIYNNSNLVEFKVKRLGVISSASYYTLTLPSCTNSVTPPSSISITPGCSYTPSPILSVNNGSLTNGSLISTTFNRSANLVICYGGIRWNSAYSTLVITGTYYRSIAVNVSENGYISGLGSSYIDIDTTDITPNYIIGWIGFTNRNLSKTYTYRGTGNLSITRSTGYAGTAAITANETGSASITQTS